VCSLKKFNPEKQFFKNDSFILLLSAEITGILIKNLFPGYISFR
jgi:hypothetical protein